MPSSGLELPSLVNISRVHGNCVSARNDGDVATEMKGTAPCSICSFPEVIADWRSARSNRSKVQQGSVTKVDSPRDNEHRQHGHQQGAALGCVPAAFAVLYMHQLNASAARCAQHRPSSAFNTPYWTTNSGAPVWNNNNSLTVGARGPILLEDYHLVEKLANFDRERIPERVVHARGASAKGFFEVNSSCVDVSVLAVHVHIQWGMSL